MLTANARIAPTAMKKMLTPIPMLPSDGAGSRTSRRRWHRLHALASNGQTPVRCTSVTLRALAETSGNARHATTRVARLGRDAQEHRMEPQQRARPQHRDGVDARAPKPPRSPAVAGWAAATRTRPTARRSRPCASCSAPSRWTVSSSSAKARKTKRRCCSTASRSATVRSRASTSRSTRSTARRSRRSAAPGAIAVIAMSERGTMFDPGPCVYMEKIAAGPAAAEAIDLNAPVKANLEAVAKALGEKVSDVTAVILDRDRHADLIRECREAGARIRLIPDGDVAGAISVAWRNSGTDVLFGIGGTPEGVIAACALKCLGGDDPRPALAAQRRRASRRARPRLRPRPRPAARRPGLRRRRLLRGNRHQRR